MYREMGMTYWLEKAEAEMRELRSGHGAAGTRDHEEPRRPHVPVHAGTAGSPGGPARAHRDGARQDGRIIPHVFHRDGEPIKSFRGAWRSACKTAGLPGRIFHDFRRTAVRNLERAGVSRSVAMQMVGNKTEAIYRRYAIVNDADLRAAAERLAAVSERPTGTITGTVGHSGAR